MNDLSGAERGRRTVRHSLSMRENGLPGSPPVWVLWCVPVAGIASVVPLWWLWRRGYWGITGEDRAAEWLTFLAYLAISVLGVVVAVGLARQGDRAHAALYVALALGALFVAGEEVNWFQRQVGFAGPESLVERNKQGVANLHNLLTPDALHAAFVAVALYASVLARRLVPRIPLLRTRPSLYVPPGSLAVWFACTWIFFAWAHLPSPRLVDAFGTGVGVEHLTGPRLEEVIELALAGGFLLFVLRIVHGQREAAATSGAPLEGAHPRVETG